MHPALAIDYGDARIGIAASDDLGILAYPVESIHRQQTEPLARIQELVEQKRIATIVLGLPLRTDGTEGAACEKVRAFAKQVEEKIPHIPIVLVDEYMTTVDAQAKLHQAGKKAKQFKGIIDQAAAVEILNSWMNCN